MAIAAVSNMTMSLFLIEKEIIDESIGNDGPACPTRIND
jgi:hypothetical protein